MIVTQSEASDEALLRFQDVMDTLKRFDMAKAYIELLQEVDSIRWVYTTELGGTRLR